MTVERALRSVPWVGLLAPDVRAELCRHGEVLELARGEPLPERALSESRVRFVGHGLTKLVYRDPDGRETIVRLASAGELHDWQPWHFTEPVPSSRALQHGTTIVALVRDQVDRAAADNPAAAAALAAAVASCCHELQHRVQDLAISPMARRIPHTIARLARRIGARHADGSWTIPGVLTRQDLADLCGTTVETTIRVMSQLQRRRLVRSSRDGLTVVDLGGLERIASGASRLAAP